MSGGTLIKYFENLKVPRWFSIFIITGLVGGITWIATLVSDEFYFIDIEKNILPIVILGGVIMTVLSFIKINGSRMKKIIFIPFVFFYSIFSLFSIILTMMFFFLKFQLKMKFMKNVFQ